MIAWLPCEHGTRVATCYHQPRCGPMRPGQRPGEAPFGRWQTPTRPAYELIGHEGLFRLPGGRTVYEAVLYDEATARSDRPRLARLETAGGLRQVNRWVDWTQPVEIITDLTDPT